MEYPRTSSSQNVLVLVNSASPGYHEFVHFVQPYLVNFGVPYDLADANYRPYTAYDFSYYALILLGHADVYDGNQYPGVLSTLEESLHNGVGLVSLDTSLFNYPSNLSVPVSSTSLCLSAFRVDNNSHYVSSLHPARENIGLYSPVSVAYNSRLVDGTVLLTGEGTIVLEAGTLGSGRMVRWNNTSWMNIHHKGPLAGMDDFLWRGLAWAARKPFVMQGMPPFVTFRVDDVIGIGTPPLYWIANANAHGFIPWCGVDTGQMSQEAIAILKDYAGRGQVTVSPHTFTQVDGDFMWFDHHATAIGRETGGPLTAAQMQNNERAIQDWFESNGIAISTYFIAHWYEMGANSVQSMLNLGAEFVLTLMPPDEFLTNGGNALLAGPYRKYQTWLRFLPCEVAGATENTDERPFYYADDAPFDPRLFLVGTEIRDDAGYEWWPTNDVDATIGRGTRQLKRCLNSMVLATLFTHESAGRMDRVTPANLEREFAGIQVNIASYNPIPITLDEGCRYVRAKTRLTLTDVVPDGDHYIVRFEGTNDMPTMAILFTNDEAEGVDVEWFEIPQANGAGQVVIG